MENKIVCEILSTETSYLKQLDTLLNVSLKMLYIYILNHKGWAYVTLLTFIALTNVFF